MLGEKRKCCKGFGCKIERKALQDCCSRWGWLLNCLKIKVLLVIKILSCYLMYTSHELFFIVINNIISLKIILYIGVTLRMRTLPVSPEGELLNNFFLFRMLRLTIFPGELSIPW